MVTTETPYIFLAFTENPCFTGVEPGDASASTGLADAQYVPAATGLFRAIRGQVLWPRLKKMAEGRTSRGASRRAGAEGPVLSHRMLLPSKVKAFGSLRAVIGTPHM